MFKMPSTTNTLEAFHGHLNEDIPRRNEFWNSLYRIIASLMKKTFRFKESIEHNYNNTKRRIKSHHDSIVRLQEMDSQMKFYSTSEANCECGETAIESAMYRCNIPCSHQFHIVQKFPQLPEFIDLKIFGNTEKLEFEYEEKPAVTQELEKSENDKQIFQAVQTIRRLSHYKNKNEIREFVQSTMEHKDIFVFGQSIGLLQTICEGIRKFTLLKKSNREIICSDDVVSDDISSESVEHDEC